MQKLAPLAGAAVGAGLMYVLDPEGGARRRALARDRIRSATRYLGDAATSRWRDTRNRSRGLLARLERHLRQDRGVARVNDQPRVGAPAANLPDVQPSTPPSPTDPRAMLPPRNWTPGARLALGTLGASILLGALRRSPMAAAAGAVTVLTILHTAANQTVPDRREDSLDTTTERYPAPIETRTDRPSLP